MNSIGNCKGCGKEILWARTSHGKNIPLDSKALVFSVVKEGNVFIAVKPTPGVRGEEFMVSHWATCPNANDFHKKAESKDSAEERYP